MLVVGCSHPGIDKVVEAAAAIDKHIHLIVGGLHLLAAKDPDIDKIVAMLHDGAKVDYIAPGHCTGEVTFAALRKAFGDHYIYAGLGTTLALGPTPGPPSAPASAMESDNDDLAGYRALLSASDDREQTEIALKGD